MSDKKQDSSPGNGPVVKNVESGDFIDRFDKHKLVNGIPRHLPLILLCMVACFTGALYITYNYLTTYQAEAIVIFQEDRDNKPLFANYSLTKVTLPTVLDLIKLPINFQAVRSVLGLNLDPKIIEGMVYVPIPRSESNLISITARADNPNLAIDIVNALARVAVKSSQDFVQKQLSAVLDNFKTQLDSTRQRLAVQLKEMEEFKKKNQYFEMTADYVTLLKDVAQTRNRLEDAKINYRRSQIEYENLHREVLSMPDLVPIPAEMTMDPYLDRIDTLESTLVTARSRYSSTNPKLISLEKELEELKQRAKQQTRSESHHMILNETKDRLEIELIRMQGRLKSSKRAQEDLEISLKEFDKQLQTLPGQQVDFARLLSNKTLTEDRIRFLTEGLETLQLMINVPKGSLELYQIADKAKPYKDSLMVRLLPILGLLGGSLLGIGLSLLLEMRDKRIWTPKQLAINYSIPYWITVPEFTLLNPSNAEEKCLFFVRGIAERLEKALPPNPTGASIVALTSAIAKEGKSLLSYCLALYYQKIGKKVLLIEGDYSPNVFTHDLAFTAMPLEEYLKGDHPFEHTVQPGIIDRIQITQKTPYMKEMVKSEKMRQLMNSFRHHYDLILIEAPGIIEYDYSANLTALADVVLYVIGSKKVEKRLVNESLNALQNLGIVPIGIILNRVLSIYIEDQRVKLELKQNRKKWIKTWFFSNHSSESEGGSL